MERFTQRARHVLSLAHQEAEGMHQSTIGTEHLLLGLIEEEGSVAGRVLRDLGLEVEVLLAADGQLGFDRLLGYAANPGIRNRRSSPHGAPLYRRGAPAFRVGAPE